MLHVLTQGDLAGAKAFIDGREHSATLRTMGEVEVFTLEQAAFEGLIESHPPMVYQTMGAIIRTVHQILLRMNRQ